MRQTSLRRRGFALSTLTLLLFTQGEVALAFKQGYHETVTEETLRSRGFDDDSADEAGDSNYWTDVFESTNDAAHADNNMLGAASTRMRDKRTAIREALNSCKRREALDALGEALHTVQDVYSHSNSIDNSIAIPDLLGMANGTAACAPPAFAPGGLVTGYFSVFGFATGNQCRGIPANMCCHRDLNKDEPAAPNGARHAPALAAARTATNNYLNLVEQDIRARYGEPRATQLINLFKRKQRTTYFVIDDTGSMGGDIAGVQGAVNGFLDQIIAAGESPSLGLVTFKDNVSDRGPSCDIQSLRQEVNALFADGGDDCPEASNSALLAAISHFPLISTDMQLRGGRVLLATDASAGDASLGPQVATQAAVKGVSIDAILTGDCTSETGDARSIAEVASSNDPTRAAAPAPVAALVDDPLTSPSARTQLRALTEQTGGVLFNVSRVEVDDVVPTLLELGEPDSAILISRKIELTAGTPAVVEIPVDESLQDKVTFMVTASRAGVLPTFTLRRPGGAAVATTDSDVAFRSLSSVASYAVTAPAAGRWEVRLEGQGAFVLRAFGGTPFRLNGLRLMTEVAELSRPEIDLLPVVGQPVVGADLVAELRLTQAPQAFDAALRRLDGSLIEDLSPQPTDTARRFRAGLRVPGESFVVEATGRTAAGNEFIRQVSIPVNPQTVSLEIEPQSATAGPGLTAILGVTVSNAAASPATYRILASASTGWPVSAPSTITVGAGGSAVFDLTVSVPAGAAQGDRGEITVFAEDLAAPRVRNSAQASVAVENTGNRAPECAAAAASPAALWPANHRLEAIGITGVADPDGDRVTVSISAITQDEPVDGTGSGDTGPDGEGVGTSTVRVRAERSGTGDGRVYEVRFTASDGKGGSCNGSVRVGVPHDQAGTAVDSGQLFDSTVR